MSVEDREIDINLPTPLSPRKQGAELSIDTSNTILPEIKAISTINRKEIFKVDPFSPTYSDPKYDSKTFRAANNNFQGASIANIKQQTKQLLQENGNKMKQPVAYTTISAP